MRFEGKIAIITGAGSGFGEGIARSFAKEGASVAVVDINSEAGKSVADSLEDAFFVEADVADNASVKSILSVISNPVPFPKVP